ncbi:tol-pal system YbgF family protein [Candidatus Latescibacterota bacterium]
MNTYTFRYFCLLFLVSCSFGFASISSAQEDRPSGSIVSISGKTVIAQFKDADISVGDEVEIERSSEIVDPISGIVRGGSTEIIARGVIEDFGLGKAQIKILEELTDQKITKSDVVVLTGSEKSITRSAESIDQVLNDTSFEPPTYGDLEEVDVENDEIVTSLGADNNISEGDFFLIQRTESTYDPETNVITGTTEINVGRGIVNSVTEKSSVIKNLDLKMEPKDSDKVVKESEYLEYQEKIHSDAGKIHQLLAEVDELKFEVQTLKTTLDSLGYNHSQHLNDFETLKTDIETVLTQLMSGDIRGSKIIIKNDEPINLNDTSNLFKYYQQALDKCLDHKFQEAIREFEYIIEQFPDSKLTENCRYWRAQSFFSMKDYPKAEVGYKEIIDDTRFTHKDDDSSIMLGITYYLLNNHSEALTEFKKFIQMYPESEYNNKVIYWINRLSS